MPFIIAWVILGLIVGGLLGSALGDSLANHPGDIGALVGGMMAGAPIGAFCAGLAAVELNRRCPAGSARRRWLVAGTWLSPVIVVFAGWLFETWRTWDDLLASGDSARLVYEVRLPPGMRPPSEKDVAPEFRSEKESRKPAFPGNEVTVKRVGQVVVVASYFDTRKTAVRRTIRIRPGGATTYVFDLKALPKRPPQGYSKDFSAWQGPEQVEEDGTPPRAPRPGDAVEIRYKMDLI